MSQQNLNASFDRFAVDYGSDEIIFCEFEPGDCFYLIQSGKVKITKIFGDIEKTLDILQPGEFFGEMAVLENTPRSATAIAVEECRVLEFNKDNFQMLINGNPQIGLKLLKLFTKRIHDQKRRFKVLTLPDLDARVADVFIMLSESQPREDEENSQRSYETSVDDIAHWAGISVPECKEVINRFVDQRRIDIFSNNIIVRNINEMIRYVNSKRKG